MKKILLIGAGFALSGFTAVNAQNNMNSQYGNNNANVNNGGPAWNSWNPNDLYRGNEFSLEAFGSVAGTGHHDDGGFHHHHDLRGGGGGGFEYFFNPYIGLEGEGFANANHRDSDESAGGNLVLRFPILPLGLAPYVFGGGGNEWRHHDADEGYGDAGAGVEFRFTPNFGIFGDGRAVIPANTRNYGMGRVGVRLAF